MSTIHTSLDEALVARSQPDVGDYFRLHNRHISLFERRYLSPDEFMRNSGSSGVVVYDPPQPTITLSVGGSLVAVSSGLPGLFTGGLRGNITTFSSASRRRMMRLMASLERDSRPIFVTLTYPDQIPDTNKAKRDIDVFGKRLVREFEGVSFIWRVEEKIRESGANMGQAAPHFHLLVYGVGLRRLREYTASAWYKVVGFGDEKHLSAGTSVDKIHSFGGVMRYAAKYLAKTEEGTSYWAGRVWGVIGRKNLPWAVRVVIDLDDRQLINLTRLGKRMLGLKGKTLVFGLTWIVNVERMIDYLESDCFT